MVSPVVMAVQAAAVFLTVSVLLDKVTMVFTTRPEVVAALELLVQDVLVV